MDGRVVPKAIGSVSVVTFDVFGTLVDWRSGLRLDLLRQGVLLTDDLFNRFVSYQCDLEEQRVLPYSVLTRRTLIDVAGLDHATAGNIAARLGRWPLFPDVRHSLRRLRQLGLRLGAITNSDVAHGEQVLAQFGLSLDCWVCAEAVGCYKPDVVMWERAAELLEAPFGPSWLHVSAYAYFDLRTARQLGLKTAFVRRPHSEPGASDVEVRTLAELVTLFESACTR